MSLSGDYSIRAPPTRRGQENRAPRPVVVRWDLYWKWLHRLAIAYPRKPTREDAILAFDRMWKFFTRLPCPKCRAHLAVYLDAHPIALADSASLQLWVWALHNNVNNRTGKPFFPLEDYKALYADDIRAHAA